ncbi:MAG: twin-arginine translocase TatA/TatE family subunit [Acidobacteriota bacterium]
MFGFLGNVGTPELLIIMFVALLVFGPSKLPELGKSIGKGLNEFKRASDDIKQQVQDAMTVEEKPEPKEDKPS